MHLPQFIKDEPIATILEVTQIIAVGCVRDLDTGAHGTGGQQKTRSFPTMLKPSPSANSLRAKEWRRSSDSQKVRRGIQIGGKIVLDPPGGSLHRMPCEVGIACGRVDPHTNPTR